MEESSNSIDNTLYMTAGIPDLIPQISEEVASNKSDTSNEFIAKHEFDFGIQEERLDSEDSLPLSISNPRIVITDPHTFNQSNNQNANKEDEEEFYEMKKSFEDVDLAATVKNLCENFPMLKKEPEEFPETVVDEIEPSKTLIIEVNRASLVSDGWMGYKSYHVYTIFTRINEESFRVNRRFRDLEWLNDILRERYKGFSIPPLPDKSFLFKNNNKFLEQRRKEIEQYLVLLSRHPILKESPPFKLFLECPDEKFDKEQQNLSIEKISFQYADFEDAVDQIVSKLEVKLNMILSRRILPFSKDLASIERTLNILEAPTYSLSCAFNNWISCQNKSLSLLGAIHFPDSSKFYQVIQENRYNLKNSFSELNSLSRSIKAESLKIDGLKNAISDYKDLMRKYSEFDLLINRKLDKQRFSIDPMKCEKYIKEIQNAQSEIENLEAELEKVEEIIKKEHVWLLADREEHFEKALNEVVECERLRYQNESAFWLDKKHDVSNKSGFEISRTRL
ncbi:unnamed protein product [Blepharisma stoltei]|uniref:PX domain-containing protein n=1 Tax=Blepharisma stoltei TaxID=1481888 RepID=A0AAU9K942_9CILI|nr:unnamed protein product [Blepharisma stoltei]